MFELVYLHPFTDERVKVREETRLLNTGPNGILIKLTERSSMIVPWHRVMSISALNTYFEEN